MPPLLSGHLAELETAAWKDDRRFRVVTVDGGVTSFIELYFDTPTKVQQARWVGGEHGGVAAGAALVAAAAAAAGATSEMTPAAAEGGGQGEGYSISSLGAFSGLR